MTAVIVTYTSIHVGPDPHAEVPYTILIVTDDTSRHVVRLDGIPDWMAVGCRIILEENKGELTALPYLVDSEGQE